MKFPFTITAGGLEISFEKVSCVQWCRCGSADPGGSFRRIGGEKQWIAYPRCRCLWRWMGQGYLAESMSHRVGVCRKHLANDFTETTLTLTEWRESDFAKNHIADIWERRRREADREDLKSELKPRRDEGVHQERRTDDQRLYVVTVVGLTREDAINIYKMADSIRAERES